MIAGTDGRFAGFEQPIVDEGHDTSVGALLDGQQAFDLADENGARRGSEAGFTTARHGAEATRAAT